MKRILIVVAGLLTTAVGVEAQNAAEIERALVAAPARARDGAAVIHWNSDFSYNTLKEGNGSLVCYDRSGAPGEAPFSSQCTHPGNLARVAQNFRFDAEGNGDRGQVRELVAAAAANGTREEAVFGSVWYAVNGPSQEQAGSHTTIAMPFATEATTGFPESGGMGAFIMAAGTSEAHLMVPGR